MIYSLDVDHRVVRLDNAECITLAVSHRMPSRRRWLVHGHQARSHSRSTPRSARQHRRSHAIGPAETRVAPLRQALGSRHPAADRGTCRSRLDPAICDRARRRHSRRVGEIGPRASRRARARGEARHVVRPPGGRSDLGCGLPRLRVCVPPASRAIAESRLHGCRSRAVGHVGPPRRRTESQGASSAVAVGGVSALPVEQVHFTSWRFST